MRITVKLFATFREGRFDKQERQYPEGVQVADVIVDVGLAGREVIIFVNNRHAVPGQALADGDTVALFPPIGGG